MEKNSIPKHEDGEDPFEEGDDPQDKDAFEELLMEVEKKDCKCQSTANEWQTSQEKEKRLSGITLHAGEEKMRKQIKECA
eukprot:14674881-Ditylum_brightwellii.AAC.1